MTVLLKKQHPLFDYYKLEKVVTLNVPSAYRGLAAFHKYWGKKPVELVSFLIEKLTDPQDIVLDPFLGGALATRCASELQRRFIGIDVNPISLELAEFFLDLPDPEQYEKSLWEVTQNVKNEIEDSYRTKNDFIASHYLWQENALQQVWVTMNRQKQENHPSPTDLKQIERFYDYSPKRLRDIVFFDNSRINSSCQMQWHDLFTGRALRNIELLLTSFDRYSTTIRRALQLTLTSNMGQMSKMVFAISHRGKSKGNISQASYCEVGSWAIGFWRPLLHFEINVWNCFFLRATKLLRLLKSINLKKTKCLTSRTINDFFRRNHSQCLLLDSCLNVLPTIPDNTVSLIITDPPHGDRMPYLELSELWNAVFSKSPPNFQSEIVVSNAKNRQKNIHSFFSDMNVFMKECARVLDERKGILALMFNAKDSEAWKFLLQETNLNYQGCFPQKYSAGSIVQDNRTGAMKEDYVLIFSKASHFDNTVFSDISGWTTCFPSHSSNQ